MASVLGHSDSSARGVAAAGILVRFAPLVAAAIAVVGILLVHADTVASIEAIWRRSETFAHGYLVVPIALWLAWRNRDSIAAAPARPWLPALAGVALAGAFWLVMLTADVLGLRQFALAFMLQAAIVAVVGLRVARAIAFPLLFLLFAVPAGEFLVPKMIELTADFTVAALRASGVPVYREANHFVIPSGAWSVVEACSGLRYLIASMMIGVLYAAVRYQSARRRIAFVAASIIVPIVANWLRAYMIVMLGHLSGNTLAVGVDHLIYGWIFFGVVMGLLFWIGSFWAEDTEPRLPRPAVSISSASGRQTPASRFYVVAVATIVIAAMWRPLAGSFERAPASVPVRLPAIEATQGWRSSDVLPSTWVPAYEGAKARLRQGFARGDESVGVHIEYYRDQRKGQELVTSTNQLVAAQDNRWVLVAQQDVEATLGDDRQSVQRGIVTGDRTPLVVYRVYWVDGRVAADEFEAKARLAWSRLKGQSDDAALVVVFARERGGESAAPAALSDLWPSIARTLEAARSAR